MRILLVGCGAIGGTVANALLRAGHDLSLVTGNPEVRDAIAAHGVAVRELNGYEWSVRPRRAPVVAAEELHFEAPFDLCLLCTKTTALLRAAQEVQPLLRAGALVLCLQNGLPEERVAAVLGPAAVAGGVVGFGATLLGPGRAQRTSRGGLQLGRHAGPPDAALSRAAALLQAVCPTRITADLAGVRWSKLAINCATSTLGAAGGDTLGRLIAHRFVRRLVLEVWTELSQVARAEGVRLARVAGTLDIASLALSEAERRARVGSPGLLYKHSILWAVGLKFRRMRSSMLIAIERGRTPEIDWLNGEVVRRGQALGLATPVNAALVRLVHDIVAHRERPGLDTLRGLYNRYVEKSGAGRNHLDEADFGAPPQRRVRRAAARRSEERGGTPKGARPGDSV